MKISKIFNVISGITIILTLVSILTVAYWLFYPYDPVTFTYSETRILNENRTVKQGDVLLSEVDLEYHYDNVPLTIDRRIVDGIVYFVPPSIVNTDKGLKKYIQNGLSIPDGLPPGTYYTELYLSFKVNPIRSILVVRKSEEFTVVAK